MFRLLAYGARVIAWIALLVAAAVFAAYERYPHATVFVGGLLLVAFGLAVEAARKRGAARHEALMRGQHVASMSPTDYEHFVADLLARAGWSAQHCGRQGDQGADVLAELRGFRAVVQVKLYRGRCGNEAVQQVVAARHHYAAQVMVVVAPSGFTASARQLAASNGVHLLHHTTLATLERVARIP